MTPVYFGSALKNYGVGSLLAALAQQARAPQPQPAVPAPVEPTAPAVSGFVFKMQANMDPNHRDRVAFLRICSGTLRRGMKLENSRTGKKVGLHNPIFLLARDRALIEEAQPGDIVGIPNHGTLRVGDTLSETGGLALPGRPDFPSEHFRLVRPPYPQNTTQMIHAPPALPPLG